MIKHGKPKGVGNEADKGKGCKHAKENEEVSKHENVSLGKPAASERTPDRRHRITITKAALSRSRRNPMRGIKRRKAICEVHFILPAF